MVPEGDPASPPANPPDPGNDLGQQQQEPPGAELTPEQLKAEVDKWKAMARKHEGSAKSNADAAKRLADLEESQKTEQQKLEDRAIKAEKELAAQTLSSTRLHVALTKQLPAELAVRLQGDTEEEMAADADKLLELMKPAGGATRPDLGQGARGGGSPAGAGDMNTLIRQAAGRS